MNNIPKDHPSIPLNPPTGGSNVRIFKHQNKRTARIDLQNQVRICLQVGLSTIEVRNLVEGILVIHELQKDIENETQLHDKKS